MLNLKCDHCGKLNPITTEYQTFCNYCNKKLKNNFADWHKLHPDKTFDDFKVLFGVPEEEPESKKKSFRQSKYITTNEHGKKKILWGALIGFIVVMGTVTFSSKKSAEFVESLFQKNTPASYLTRQWKTNTYGQYGLTLSLPVAIKETDMGFPQQIIDLTDYIKSFKTAENEPVQVFIDVIKYKSQFPVSLQGGANGAVNEMKSKPEVSEFNYTEKPKEISGYPAILQTGSFLSHHKYKLKFYDLIILHDHNVWQVAIIYRKGDENGQKVADRIIGSVAIKR